jgi:tetraacyldisaccharide 4'-kinase
MDEASYLRLVRGQARGPLAAVARAGLAVAAGGYALGARARNLAYDRGWWAAARAEAPVIAVGNLTLGGTGKTPMVEWVCRHLRRRGLRVAILSRGHGARDGLNDEGRVLEDNLPDVPHLQGRDRARLAAVAVEELESQALVLDDGLQHRRLARDLDIVLLDATDPFGLGWICPRGLLREPVTGLRRAGAVVLTRADQVDESTRERARERALRAAGDAAAVWAEARHAPRDVLVHGSEPRSVAEVLAGGPRVAAFCGIGNPAAFGTTLDGLGLDRVGLRAFPDHHAYTASDVADLARWAAGLRADLILTTQKDSVKLRTPALGPVPLGALRIGLEITRGETELAEAVDRATRATETP